MNRFTDKQKAFINHYLICLNATESAEKAGYKGNYDTLRSVGSENLSKPNIRAEINKRLSKLTMSANETLKRVSDIASGDMLQFIDSRGELDIKAMREAGMGRLLKKYKKTKRIIPRKNDEPIEVEHIEVELYAADSAQDKLMRYYSLYKDTVTHEWREIGLKAGASEDEIDKVFEADVEAAINQLFRGKQAET